MLVRAAGWGDWARQKQAKLDLVKAQFYVVCADRYPMEANLLSVCLYLSVPHHRNIHARV